MEIAEMVSQRVDALLCDVCDNRKIRLLEAGCGSASKVHLKAASHIVGIDISEDQLLLNNAIQEKIHGDLQEYPLPKNEFDVVVCWYVLEHLDRPQDALRNLFAAARRSGLVILAVPNLLSFKGIATKFTPFWFHNLFYRYMRYTSRPFPTFLRSEILPDRIVEFAATQGVSVVYSELFEGNVTKALKRRIPVLERIFTGLDSLVRFAFFGRLQSLLLDNCVLILQKD
jgi:SAM-dependent methyltransferase